MIRRSLPSLLSSLSSRPVMVTPLSCGDFVVPPSVPTPIPHQVKSYTKITPSPSWHVSVTPVPPAATPIAHNTSTMVELDGMYQTGLKLWHSSSPSNDALATNRDDAQYHFARAAIRGHSESGYMLHVECALTMIFNDEHVDGDTSMPYRAALWQGIPSVMKTHLEAKEVRAHAGDIASLCAVHTAWRQIGKLHEYRAAVARQLHRPAEESHYIALAVAAQTKVVHWYHQHVDRTDLHV